VGSVKSMIQFVSQEYNYKYELVDWLIFKESSYRTNVYGDAGKAFGLAQFHLDTWKYFQKKYNRYDLNINNPVDQIIMTVLALKDNKHCHWTALKKIYKCK
jgi:hypothetical protein